MRPGRADGAWQDHRPRRFVSLDQGARTSGTLRAQRMKREIVRGLVSVMQTRFYTTMCCRVSVAERGLGRSAWSARPGRQTIPPMLRYKA